jgi:hypothetical protein
MHDEKKIEIMQRIVLVVKALRARKNSVDVRVDPRSTITKIGLRKPGS